MSNTPPKEQRSKAHHVLPQFYLRGWANEHGAVAMLNRDGKEVRTGTRALAVENDFYTLTLPDGTKDSTVEDALAHWDAKGAAVIAGFLRGEFPPNEEERIELGLWLGLQWLRGRSSRRTGAEVVDKLQKLLIKLGLEERRPPDPYDPPHPEPDLPDGIGPGIEVPDLTGLPDEVKEILGDPDSYTFEPSRAQQLLQMLKAVPQAAEPFIESEWHLLRFEEPLLLTSDEPIMLGREPTPQNQFLGLGPANADYLSIALSPYVCLGMIRTSPIGREADVTLPAGEAQKQNLALLDTWWQQLFRHPDGPPFPTDFPPLPEERVVEG
jgi:hypothetical protein